MQGDLMKIDTSMVAAGGGVAAGKVSLRPTEGLAATSPGTVGQATAKADEADLSQTARDVCVAQKALAATPDVREDKVAELKQKIADGTFEVNADLIADKIIEGGP